MRGEEGGSRERDERIERMEEGRWGRYSTYDGGGVRKEGE